MHNNFTEPAIMYLLLHGLYGFGWLTKHMVYRDKNFDVPATPAMFISVFLLVDLYWIGPYLLTKYRFDESLGKLELFAAMILWGGGNFLHYVSVVWARKWCRDSCRVFFVTVVMVGDLAFLSMYWSLMT